MEEIKKTKVSEWFKEHKKEFLLGIGFIIFTIYKVTIGLIF